MRKNKRGVRAALKHPALVGKEIIGRGFFSLVFDHTPETVLKLTADHTNYEIFCNERQILTSPHFPRMASNHGVVGETVNGLDHPLPIFLMEVERLEKVTIRGNRTCWNISQRICSVMAEIIHDIDYSRFPDESRTMLSAIICERVARRETIPGSIREAFEELSLFTATLTDAEIDLHSANIMMRPATGEVVLSDPLCDLASVYT
jgi:hypothetical protein